MCRAFQGQRPSQSAYLHFNRQEAEIKQNIDWIQNLGKIAKDLLSMRKELEGGGR